MTSTLFFTDLTRNQINWTHSDLASRFEVTVGVDYSSDVKQVMQILKAAVDSQMGVLKQPDPFIRFTDFGDSSLNFSIIFGRKNCFALKISRAK
jgi:small-conductance mechanosensitive channel